MHGHDVTIFEARKKSGGLNEYGIAAYKSVDDFAAKEVDFVLSIGGIKIEHGMALGKKLKLADLQNDYDAVFLGLGLSGVNALGAKNEDADGIVDAVDYISDLRQAKDLSKLKVGRNVVVIGGGMTAIDIAVQSKLLGAENVTVIYRRGAPHMKASAYEQELAQTKGVNIKHWVAPKKVLVKSERVIGLKCENTSTGEKFEIQADMIFKAIGQTYNDVTSGTIALDQGRIKVDSERRTSVKGIWAGGDCIAGGKDLTVASVDDGRRAAESINKFLKG
jgi:dihydropyrimidine dehydrogenase (NAD+) subunit PreT